MNKKYWYLLQSLFNEEELKKDYKEVENVINKIVESIELEEKREALSKELQELNKDEN